MKNNLLKPFFDPVKIEAGCDEAGRGCLAGPVYAAAVILPKDFSHPLLTDSKKTTEAQRIELRSVIEKSALSWAVASLSHKEIDRYNILRASFLAMHRAIKKLQVSPELLLIDGNRFIPFSGIEHQCIVKGDAKFNSIAAASILAKTYRDDYMAHQAQKFPQYGWLKNKGYPTAAHRKAIMEHGPCTLHRKTFALYPKTMNDEQTKLKL